VIATPNKRVLLVDDTPAIHEDFRKILTPSQDDSELEDDEALLFGTPKQVKEIPFQLDSAYQGAEALAMVETALKNNQPYAVAFVDMRMPPGWDGLETIERLWQVDPDVQIVICTAFTDHSWDEMRVRLDTRDRLLILKKPFDVVEVFQLAGTLTNKWNLSRQAKMVVANLEAAVLTRTQDLVNANEELKREGAERLLLESQLVQSEKLASMGQLAAGVAHEINTPIQYVTDNVNFLQRSFAPLIATATACGTILSAWESGQLNAELVDEERAQLKLLKLDYIKKNVPAALEQSLHGLQRVTSIVGAMKKFSHPSDGKKEMVEAVEMIDVAVTMSRNEWKNVAMLDVIFEPNLPAVACIRDELEQVILNLVVNAAHAIAEKQRLSDQTRAEDRIIVRARRADEFLEIQVQDTGAGIPLEVQGRVFDPFFTTKPVGKGTGQGLTICYATIVNHHQGELFFKTSGDGTTFFIRIPYLLSIAAKGSQ
jgi:two-component system NtrC family sensor kinase